MQLRKDLETGDYPGLSRVGGSGGRRALIAVTCVLPREAEIRLHGGRAGRGGRQQVLQRCGHRPRRAAAGRAAGQDGCLPSASGAGAVQPTPGLQPGAADLRCPASRTSEETLVL